MLERHKLFIEKAHSWEVKVLFIFPDTSKVASIGKFKAVNVYLISKTLVREQSCVFIELIFLLNLFSSIVMFSDFKELPFTE